MGNFRRKLSISCPMPVGVFPAISQQSWNWVLFLAVGTAGCTLAHGTRTAKSGASAAPSAAPAAPAPAKAATFTRPCAPQSVELVQAQRDLDSIDAAIQALPPNGPTEPLISKLNRLGKSPCFAFGGNLDLQRSGPEAESADDEDFPDSALSLKTYWDEGGRDAIQSYLDLGVPGASRRPLVFPPSFRKTLSRESAPKHPWVTLLCSSTDPECAAGSLPYRRRAETRFVAAPEGDPAPPEYLQCVAKARADRHHAFTSWASCLPLLATTEWKFPLVGFRKPTTGWLVLTGRRGHYSYCDEYKAFSLTTGAVLSTSSCSDLDLQNEGQVDPRETDANRKEAAGTARATTEFIREATWMLLNLKAVSQEILSVSRDLPPDIQPLEEGEPLRGVFGMGGIGLCGSSGDTELHWAWVDGAQVLADGDLIWPGCESTGNIPNNYAVELIQIAEASQEPGCAPPGSPLNISALGPRLKASGLDTDTESLALAQSRLLALWRKLANTPCPAKGHHVPPTRRP